MSAYFYSAAGLPEHLYSIVGRGENGLGLVYCSALSSVFEKTLYFPSNQAPKSISLHRSQQKGKKFVFFDCSLSGRGTAFLQIGQKYFILIFATVLL